MQGSGRQGLEFRISGLGFRGMRVFLSLRYSYCRDSGEYPDRVTWDVLPKAQTLCFVTVD